MAKGILEFDLDEPFDRSAFRRANAATDVYIALHAISNEVFRPHRKHGYNDRVLNDLIENRGEEVGSAVLDAIEVLEGMFFEILQRYNIDMNDLD